MKYISLLVVFIPFFCLAQYENPSSGIVDYGAFSRGYNQTINSYNNQRAISNYNKAKAKENHERAANNSPEIDFNKGNFKNIGVWKGSKYFNIKYFLPQYWADETNNSNWDFIMGRTYANGRKIIAAVQVGKEIFNKNPTVYINEAKEILSKQQGFKKQISGKFTTHTYSSDILIYQEESNFGVSNIIGNCITRIDSYNYLMISFSITPISSDLEREYSVMAKTLEYLLGNISID